MSSNAKKYDFTGKVALVTGSSSGIGAAIATQLAQYGAKVTITGRDAAALEKVAQEITKISGGHQPLQIVGNLLEDVLPEKLINETVAKFGRLDVLVNNAGGGTPKGNLASENLLEEFDNVMKLNVRVPVELTQRAAPHLEKTRGNIINIGSIASAKAYTVVYSTSKAALDMVTKTSALELGPKGVRVNSINPGPVRTGFPRSMGHHNPKAIEAVMSALEPMMLMKRVGATEDIANLASFLASENAKNITGSIFFSDSGALLYSPDLKHVDLKSMAAKAKE